MKAYKVDTFFGLMFMILSVVSVIANCYQVNPTHDFLLLCGLCFSLGILFFILSDLRKIKEKLKIE